MNNSFFQYFVPEKRTLSTKLFGRPEGAQGGKAYPFAATIALPPPERPEASLAEVLAKRRSTYVYHTAPTLLQLSSLLYWSTGRRAGARGGKKRRPHPSGGARYPIELYLINRGDGELAGGAYHYNIGQHCLEVITQNKPAAIKKAVGFAPQNGSSCTVLCMTFIRSRAVQTYDQFAYKLGLIEAGHIGQNVYLVAEALGMGCCAFGGGDTRRLHKLLELDGGNEHLVYLSSVGGVA